MLGSMSTVATVQETRLRHGHNRKRGCVSSFIKSTSKTNAAHFGSQPRDASSSPRARRTAIITNSPIDHPTTNCSARADFPSGSGVCVFSLLLVRIELAAGGPHYCCCGAPPRWRLRERNPSPTRSRTGTRPAHLSFCLPSLRQRHSPSEITTALPYPIIVATVTRASRPCPVLPVFLTIKFAHLHSLPPLFTCHDASAARLLSCC